MGFVFIDQGEFKNESSAEANDATKKKEKESLVPPSYAFNPKDNISAGLQQLVFVMPGSVIERNLSDVETTWLAITGPDTGFKKLSDILEMGPMGPIGAKPDTARRNTSTNYIMASEIRGKADAKSDKPKAEEKKDGKDGAKPAKTEFQRKDLHVVVVSDIDCLSDPIFMIRAKGRDNPMMDIKFDFDNVPFILNILDKLAGDTRFIEIRKHRPLYRTLERIEQESREAKKNVNVLREKFQKEVEKSQKEAKAELEKKFQDINNRSEEDSRELTGEILMKYNLENQKLQRKAETQEREYKRFIEEAEREEQDRLNGIQLKYKAFSVILPPILPLFVALCVFIYRARREREGIASSRLR
jgi:hypothetical protein